MANFLSCGMDRNTGAALSDLDHIRQSINDILTTPIGTRVQRRDYGSMLPELIDAPLNESTKMKILGATAMAIRRWEPRVRLQRVQFLSLEANVLCLDLSLLWRREGVADVPFSFGLTYER